MIECQTSNCGISIHALRGEGDLELSCKPWLHRYFNPRPPWGGRLSSPIKSMTLFIFQSTPSVGRATQNHSTTETPPKKISIHALRGEGDFKFVTVRGRNVYFNPRPPWGGRRYRISKKSEEARYFNPRPPWGGRRANASLSVLKQKFQSTPSVGRATG